MVWMSTGHLQNFIDKIWLVSIGESDTCECLSSSDDMASLMLPTVAATKLVSKEVAALVKLNTLKFVLYGHNNGL